MDEFIGIIKLFAGTYAPHGWAFCDGRYLNISEYSALYALIGTQFGGDGRTNFRLPDLRSRVPVCAGQGQGLSPYQQGQYGGFETNTLTTAQMPAHKHSVKCDVITTGRNLSGSPVGCVPANLTEDKGYGTDLSGNTIMHDDMISQTGGNSPVENRQPFLAINYIICLVGVFPPRD